MWLREIIGYVLTQLEDEDSGLHETRQLLTAQLQSGIVDDSFAWSRYRLTLKTADFMDDLSIVAPQDLMVGNQQPNDPFGGGGGGMPAGGGHDDFGGAGPDQEQNNLQNQMAEEQLNNMINQLAQPINPVLAQ